jgi:hypothetical protein
MLNPAEVFSYLKPKYIQKILTSGMFQWKILPPFSVSKTDPRKQPAKASRTQKISPLSIHQSNQPKPSLLVAYWAYSSPLKMESVRPVEMFVNL